MHRPPPPNPPTPSPTRCHYSPKCCRKIKNMKNQLSPLNPTVTLPAAAGKRNPNPIATTEAAGDAVDHETAEEAHPNKASTRIAHTAPSTNDARSTQMYRMTNVSGTRSIKDFARSGFATKWTSSTQADTNSAQTWEGTPQIPKTNDSVGVHRGKNGRK